ncbi:MAG: DUF2332 domain-containing protein [Actinobacteria bacterium]|nr:DUF2332 domain-containing protein [Actinomycetota bacterium]
MAAVGYAGRSDAPERTARLLQWQAAACRQLGSPIYGEILRHAADDLLAGGPVADVLDGYLDDRPASGLALRLLGGVHFVVLSGRAPELASYYPSAGGSPERRRGAPRTWSAVRQVLADHGAEVRCWLARPPQTNEVGRAAALIGGLRHVAAEASMPIRLVEVGASAGLNLRADCFCVPGPAGRHGDTRSPVVLTGGWTGDAPPDTHLEIVERTGGDLVPIDPLTELGRLTLTAYIWPDQADRLSRLSGAFVVAGQVPAELRAESAADTLARTTLVSGAWTVLWHSIFRQYLDEAQRAELALRVAALGAAATSRARFAYLYFEPSRVGGCRVTLTTWPGEDRRVLGSAPAHGLPVHWHAAA